MNSRSNQILAGIIVFLIAVFLIFQKGVIGIGSILYFFVGIAFILLYMTKKKSWSLILGSYMSWFGFSSIINKFLNYKDFFNLTFASFFIVTALIFFVFYFDKRKTGLLTPACILMWIGIYSILKDVHFIPIYNTGFSLFMVCFGMSFITSYFLGRGVKGTLYTGIIFIVIGCAFVFSGKIGWFLGMRQLLCILLVIVCISIALNAIKNKR